MMRRIMMVTLTAALFATGCSMFTHAPENYRKGPDVILILIDPSGFKNSLAQGITDYATVEGYRIQIDDVKRAKYYNASDFAAVIYMAEYWMWHVPLHAKRYYRDNDEAANIIFLVTSGDPDVKIAKPFDAVTTASDPERKNDVLREVYDRLDTIFESEKQS